MVNPYVIEPQLGSRLMQDWEAAWQMAWVADTPDGIDTATEFVLGSCLDERRRGNLLYFLEIKRRICS